MKIISLENLKTFYNNSKKSFGNMTNITYAELKILRDNSQLVEGQYYRITDFVTTVDQEDAKSAGHRFDIIVLATSSNTLNENALAAKHAEDTYFDNSNLDVWELKYDLDNDKSKYAWADETNGKGVIYYMKDEFNNECSYDFKNVLFKRYKLKNRSGLHIADALLSSNFYSIKQAFENLKNNLYSSMNSYNISFYYTKGIYTDGYLVSGDDIYNYDDEVYSSYDEGTLVFNENSGGNYVGVYSIYEDFDIIAEVEDTNGEWFYTFSKKTIAADAAVDASLSKLTNVECYNNSIKEYIKNELYDLNNNIFIIFDSSGKIYNNNFNINCSSNTFGKNFYFNTFGINCNYNTFESNCNYNTFGNNCYSNTTGSECRNNTFKSNCYSNTIGSNCNYNTFGKNFYFNTFGLNCGQNTFGNNCNYNKFGNNCHSNTFVSECRNNTFGNYLDYNTFNSSTSDVSFELYTTGSSMKIQYLTIYKVNNNTTIPANLITLNANYSQVLGLNSSGKLVCKPVLD